MNSKTHAIIGATSAITVATLAATTFGDFYITSAGAAFMGALGGVMPDIDKASSRVGLKFQKTSLAVEKAFGHRGLLHTPVFLLGLMLLNHTIFNNLIILKFFEIGWLSHLLLDLLTPKGIMLLYPINKKFIHLFGLKCKWRNLIVGAIVFVAEMYVVYLQLTRMGVLI